MFQLPTVKTTVKTIRLKRVTYSDFRPRNLSTLFLFLRHFSGPAAAGLFGTLTTDETVGHVPGSLQQPQNPFHHVPHPHRHPGDRFCSDRSAGCFLKVCSLNVHKSLRFKACFYLEGQKLEIKASSLQNLPK